MLRATQPQLLPVRPRPADARLPRPGGGPCARWRRRARAAFACPNAIPLTATADRSTTPRCRGSSPFIARASASSSATTTPAPMVSPGGDALSVGMRRRAVVWPSLARLASRAVRGDSISARSPIRKRVLRLASAPRLRPEDKGLHRSRSRAGGRSAAISSARSAGVSLAFVCRSDGALQSELFTHGGRRCSAWTTRRLSAATANHPARGVRCGGSAHGCPTADYLCPVL